MLALQTHWQVTGSWIWFAPHVAAGQAQAQVVGSRTRGAGQAAGSHWHVPPAQVRLPQQAAR